MLCKRLWRDWIFFAVLLTFSISLQANREQQSQELVEKLKQAFSEKTQSGAVLRVKDEKGSAPPLARYVQLYFQRDIFKDASWDFLFSPEFFKNFWGAMAERENEYCNHRSPHSFTHYVFYHGCHANIAYFQDLLAVFFDVFKNKKLGDSYFLRVPDKTEKESKDSMRFDTYKDVTALVKTFAKTSWWDAEPGMRKICLAVNPTPFNYLEKEFSESSLNYCLMPLEGGGAKSLQGTALTLDSLLKNLLNYFGLDEQFIKQLGDVIVRPEFKSYFEKNGFLLQIFVPKDVVDSCAYLALKGGDAIITPRSGNFSDQVPPSRILSLLATDPLELLAYDEKPFQERYIASMYMGIFMLLRMQYRLLLMPDVFPDRVKIYRYSKIQQTAQEKQKYFDLLYKIVREIKSGGKEQEKPGTEPGIQQLLQRLEILQQKLVELSKALKP